jgi:hypothetical protein
LWENVLKLKVTCVYVVFVCVCVCVCPSPEMFIYSGNCIVLFPSTRENQEHCLSDSTSMTFLTQDSILISLHVFVFVFIVQQDIVFIHDAVLFFLHVCVCVCVLRKYWSLSWVIWCIFYSDTFPQISQSFLLYKKKIYRVSPLLIPGNAVYPS